MGDAHANVVSTTPVTGTGAMASCPSVVANGSGWAVAWTDRRDGNAEIYFARLDAMGMRIGDEVRVTNEPSDASCSQLVWNGSKYAIVFDDARFGDTEILIDFRTVDGTEIGTTPVRVTNDGGESTNPTIGWDGSGYDVAWTNTTGVNDSIHALQLDENGALAGVEQTLSGTAAFVRVPIIFETTGGAAIAWYDSSGMADAVRVALVNVNAQVFDMELGHAVVGSSFTGGPVITRLSDTLAVIYADGDSTFPATYQFFLATVSSTGMATVPHVLDMTGHTHPASVTTQTGFAMVSEPGIRFIVYNTMGTPTDAPLVLSTNGSTPSIAFEEGVYGVAYAKTSSIVFARVMP